MLSEPLPPATNKPVSLVVLHKDLMAELFGIPYQHVVINLHSLSVQHDVADPVRQPARCIHLVEQALVQFTLGLNVLEKDYLEEVSFKENVDDAGAHLHYSEVEEKGGPQKGEMHVVIHICE